jgi:two-component system KDP operon response regulator KdpE
LLASDAGKIVTHEHLLKTVWGEIYKDHVEYLRTYVAQIRRKIEKDPTQPELIITEAGLGYRFREPD